MPNCPKDPEDKARTEGTELCLKSRQGKSTPTRFLGKLTIDNIIEEEKRHHLQKPNIQRRIVRKWNFHSQGTTQNISQEPNRGK
jgi:hypothetical protein